MCIRDSAGTGHAALCELNYMPEAADGSPVSYTQLDVDKRQAAAHSLAACNSVASTTKFEAARI